MDTYREYLPPPALAGLVRVLWSVQEVHTPQTEQHNFLPERSVRLTFCHGQNYLQVGSELRPLPQVYVMGLYSQPLTGVSHGATLAVGVELYPWGAVQLLGHASNDQALLYPGQDQSLLRLSERIQALLAGGQPEEALHQLQLWLLARAHDRAREPGAAVQAASALYREPGRGSVGELADRLGLSPRSLERQFRSEVGISPKSLARLIRFEEAHNLLWQDPEQSLTELAYALNYADQAHFTRDFRSFAQMSPGSFLRYVRQARTAYGAAHSPEALGMALPDPLHDLVHTDRPTDPATFWGPSVSEWGRAGTS